MLNHLNGFMKPSVNKNRTFRNEMKINSFKFQSIANSTHAWTYTCGRWRTKQPTHTQAHQMESQKFVRFFYLQTLTRFGDDDDNDETERKSKQDYF